MQNNEEPREILKVYAARVHKPDHSSSTQEGNTLADLKALQNSPMRREQELHSRVQKI